MCDLFFRRPKIIHVRFYSMKQKASGVLPAVRKWYKVDNAANMYCFAQDKNFSRTYRNSVLLRDEIDIPVMQAALEKTMKRFPTMSTVLRSGAFWPYLEHTSEVPEVHEELCRPGRYIIHNGENTPCSRFSVYKNRLSIEMFHGLADGAGSTAFVRTLITTYFELKGVKVSSYGDIKNTADEPTADEVEDSNARYAEPVKKAEKPKESPVYIGENDQIKDYTRFVFGRFPVEDVKAAGKKYGLTITEYLCVAMILMFIKCSPEPVSLPIKISVPVDLRRRFPSDSVRNFVFMTDVTFNPQGRTDVTFEDIADSVRGMAAAGATPEKLRAAVSTNVAAERNPITSAVPYPVKKAVMKQSYLDMQYSYTTILSNLGEIKFPSEIAPLVLEADCCLNKTPFLHFGCAAVSLNGIFNLTFTSANTNTEREKFFFRLLSSHGIRVRVDSTEQA